jgi:glucan biosynthesis protein C
MATTLQETIRPVQAEASVQARATVRLLFVDNLRVFLTILVLLHHLMITYAASGSWIYVEGRQDVITDAIGNWFCFINQSYFMSLFLLISAYFVPGSYERKGTRQFLKDRLIRLGIPLAIYSWLIHPLLVYGFLYTTQSYHLPFLFFYTQQYFKYGTLLGAGPLWFVEVLLIFSLFYVVWRLIARNSLPKGIEESRFPSSMVIVIFAILLGIASFLVRLWHPTDWNFTPLNLQFPYFVPYIALFVVGLVAYRRNWLLSLPDPVGRHWLALGITLILAFPPLGLLLNGSGQNDALFKGGWHWQALLVAFYEAILCLSMCIGLVYVFRRYANQRGNLARFLVPNAYTAYLIHAPVLVIVALAMRNVDLYPLLKFVLAGLVAVPLCFLISDLIRKLPYTQRVL